MKKIYLVFLLIGIMFLGNVYSSFSQTINTYPTLRITGISLTATDNKGVTGYLINEIPSTPNLDDVNWSSTPPLEYTFDSEGTKILYAWAKDAAGNISESLSVSLIIEFPDVEKPVITNFGINPVSACLKKPVKIRKLTATDNNTVTGYLVNETSTSPRINDPAWSRIPPRKYRLENSVITLFAHVIDEAGNITSKGVEIKYKGKNKI